MITIIKRGKGKTQVEKENERRYVTKCKNCRTKFIYNNQDKKRIINEYVVCPVCENCCFIAFDIIYFGKLKSR